MKIRLQIVVAGSEDPFRSIEVPSGAPVPATGDILSLEGQVLRVRERIFEMHKDDTSDVTLHCEEIDG